jgi:hypothetical protein
VTFSATTKVLAPSHVQFSHRLNDVPVGEGIGIDADELREELLDYANTLLRGESPVNSPYLSLMEVANAYHARALEIEMMIFDLEHEGKVVRGHPLYRFRTGQLRSFIEMAKKMIDVGSRRLSQEVLLTAQRRDVGEAL